jgi:SAM-dependent methyltransferase
MTDRPVTQVRSHYDAYVQRKLGDFVKGNPRMVAAWTTIQQVPPRPPRRILEIGASVGDMCWRMSHKWPNAQIVGVELSPACSAVAQEVFARPQIRFFCGQVPELSAEEPFDLVILVDVYEHIDPADRPGIHAFLKEHLRPGSRIFFSIPTPRHLADLRANKPEEIAPVDEDITMEVLDTFANETGTTLISYREFGVWREGDYAQVVFGRTDQLVPVPGEPSTRTRIRNRGRDLVRDARLKALMLPAARKRRVQKALNGSGQST